MPMALEAWRRMHLQLLILTDHIMNLYDGQQVLRRPQSKMSEITCVQHMLYMGVAFQKAMQNWLTDTDTSIETAHRGAKASFRLS